MALKHLPQQVVVLAKTHWISGMECSFAGNKFIALIALFVFACSALAEGPQLLIFHTNDVHGYALAEKGSTNKSNHIGYAKLKAYINAQAARHKILLDAGDALSGQAFATYKQGEFVARLLEAMDYTAQAVGNHEFDFDLSRLMDLRERHHLNFLAANIRRSEDGGLIFPAYIIREFDGIKVGIFGLTTLETRVKTMPANVAGVQFGNPEQIAATARDMVTLLRGKYGVDLVVALTHVGTDSFNTPNAQYIAAHAPGIDLVVDGHSHTVEPGLRVGGALIVSTGSYLEYLGQVAVDRDDKGRVLLESRLIPAADFDAVVPDPALEELSQRLVAEQARELNGVVGHTPVFLDGEMGSVRHGSTGLGRLVCAAMMKATGADLAMINSGSIRASIKAGDISGGDLLSALPFANYAVTVRLSGAQIVEVLNAGLRAQGGGKFLQFYGLQVTAKEVRESGPDGLVLAYKRVETVKIGGQALNPAAQYTVAVNDFMVGGGDAYAIFSTAERVAEFTPVNAMFLAFMAAASPETLSDITRNNALTIAVDGR
ncbi:metallophosphatase [Betaproteobacteria bacterium]|nr:metallophosphatase [Betaproteobacteria bacterium]GHU18744.1 metallophosphatase [Betaproteobacteria bacterium]